MVDILKEKGYENVAFTDLTRDDMSEAVEDAFRYGRLIVAAASYDGGVFPPMEDFVNRLSHKAYQKRKVGIIENGSWAPTAARWLKTAFEGMKNITNAPTFTPKLGGEASVYLGFSLEPHIGIISESVADVGLNAELGAETTAKLIHTDTAKQDENKKHDCKNCIKGDINGKLKLGFKESLLNSNKLTFTYNDEKTLKIADYYYSMDYHQGGLSTCPHWSYRIIANVQGKNGVPLLSLIHISEPTRH